MKHFQHIGSILSLLLLALALASCGGGGGGSSSPSTSTPSSSRAAAPAPAAGGQQAVSIRNFTFVPGMITVRKGARITISNRDSTAHTATADGGSSFDTGTIDPGSSSAITLNSTGRFPYHCSIHPFMHGTIVVQPAGGPS